MDPKLVAVLPLLWLVGAPGGALAQPASGSDTAGPAAEQSVTGARTARASFDPAPELQQAAGGGLIVNAFIMDGPVRVEIRNRESGELVMERDEDALFPFEVRPADLGIDADQAEVLIYVDGQLTHTLELER